MDEVSYRRFERSYRLDKTLIIIIITYIYIFKNKDVNATML